MSDHLIGVRTEGKRAIDERWYFCGVCGRKVPESESTVPLAPMPHAGIRVCNAFCLDEPSFDYYRQIAPPIIGRDELD